MLAHQRRYKDFISMAAYLVRPERETGPERIAWTATRNLPTQDPELAAQIMRDTAARSTLTQKPAYHLVLSAAPGDPIDRAKLERITDRVLERLGLSEHQAVLVAHVDRPHYHVHILVNRVHPVTGRAWNSWHDWAPTMAVLREEERALGLHQVQPVPSLRELMGELSRDLERHERLAAVSRELQQAEQEVHAARARATRVEQTAARAQATGERRDAALAQVYRDPHHAHRAYLAAVDREGLPAATERVRERPEAFGALRTVERSRALGLAHRPDEGPARAAARAAAPAAQAAAEAARAWRIVAVAEAERAQLAFTRELEQVYQDPTAARTEFHRVAAERGVEQAAATLAREPATLGAVRACPSGSPHEPRAELAQAAAWGVEAAQARAAAATLGGDTPARSPVPVRAELDRALARDRALRADFRALPSREELERRLRVALERLSPRALAVLKRHVTGPQFAIALRLRRTLRDLALGRADEREE